MIAITALKISKSKIFAPEPYQKLEQIKPIIKKGNFHWLFHKVVSHIREVSHSSLKALPAQKPWAPNTWLTFAALQRRLHVYKNLKQDME